MIPLILSVLFYIEILLKSGLIHKFQCTKVKSRKGKYCLYSIPGLEEIDEEKQLKLAIEVVDSPIAIIDGKKIIIRDEIKNIRKNKKKLV